MKSPHEKTENNNTSVAKTQPPKKEGSDVNIYSPQQAQKVYRCARFLSIFILRGVFQNTISLKKS